MSDWRFCSLPEFLAADAALNAWRKRRLRWCITGGLPGVSDEEIVACYAAAWGVWAEVCGLSFEYTEEARSADVRMGSGLIDGAGRTLAWSELPNGSDGPLRQMYDTGEGWYGGLDMDAIPDRLIPLLVTAAHECGHAIGLGHSQDRKALMYPSLNVGSKGRPQAWDVSEARARYGPAQPAPQPPTPPPPTPTPPTPGAGIVLRLHPESKVIEIPSGWQPRYAS